MRQTLHILRKDLRRLWWEITVACALTALYAQTYIATMRADIQATWLASALAMLPLPDNNAGMLSAAVWSESRFYLQLILPLAWSVLIAAAIQAEPLTGDRAFWLTRPYRRSSLIAAKALFILICISLPYFLSDCTILMFFGFDPWNHLAAFVPRQLWFVVVFALPIAALAAITRNMTQFLFTALALYAAMALTGSLPWSQPVSIDFFPKTTLANAALAAFGLAALWSQYRRRNTLVARACFLAGLAIALALNLAPLHSQLNAETAFSPASTPQATLILDPSRRVEASTRSSSPDLDPNELLRIPVAPHDLPPGYLARVDTASVEIPSLGFSTGASSDLLVPGINPQWLKLSIKRELADRIRSVKPAARLSAYLTLFRERDAKSYPSNQPVVTPLGLCTPDRYGAYRFGCLTPFWIDTIASVQLVSRETGASSPHRLVQQRVSYLLAPLSTPGANALANGDTLANSDLVITTVEPAGHVQTQLELPALAPPNPNP